MKSRLLEYVHEIEKDNALETIIRQKKFENRYQAKILKTIIFEKIKKTFQNKIKINNECKRYFFICTHV